jgi:hypothetical protein
MSRGTSTTDLSAEDVSKAVRFVARQADIDKRIRSAVRISDRNKAGFSRSTGSLLCEQASDPIEHLDHSGASPQFVFPDCQRIDLHLSQRCVHGETAVNVPTELVRPISSVCFWQVPLTCRTAVPETSVKKNREFRAREEEIRHAR